MAKTKAKKYITPKLKRKFVLGGNTEPELYLNNNTTYQAQDAPTAMLQNQFDANEQAKAKQNTTIFGNQMARQMDYLQDINAASNARKKEEQQAKTEAEQQTIQNAQKQVTTAAGLAAKDVANTIATVGTASKLPGAQAGPILSKADAKMLGVKSASRFAGEGVSKFSYGSNLANLGVGVGLGLVGEGIGYLGNRRDDKLMKEQGRSQYYDDTNYSRAEFNSQLGKSTFKGAGMGSTFGPVGTAIGAGVGALYGLGKAVHERRQTKSEDERGVKIGDKRFGKKLLFGDENVYDENLDPTVIEARNREAQIKAMGETASALDTARLGSMTQYDTNTGFNLKTTTGQMAKYGGKLEYLNGGVAKDLGRGAKEYVGKKHEQGGIDLPGNIEVEGGETEQNDYVFSASLKLPTGITYAQAHKNLLKSGASSEEIKQLALSQEAAAGRNPNEIKTMKFAKYGGPLKYDKGGNIETDPPKEGEEELDFDAKTKMRIHTNEGVSKNGLTTPYLDSKGYWTVGHGHLLTKADGTPYTKNDKLPAEFGKITEQQVKDWAKSDYDNLKQSAINWVGKDAWENLPEAVKSGVIELSYGVGPKGLEGFKNTKKFLIEGDYESAAENITNSKYFKDVAERRGTQVAALIGGDQEVFNNSASKDQYTVPKEKALPYLTNGKQLNNSNFINADNSNTTTNDIPTLQKMLADSGMSDEEFGGGMYPKELVAKLRQGTATIKEFEDAKKTYEVKQLERSEEPATTTNEVLNAVFKPKLHKGTGNPYIPIGVTAAKNIKEPQTVTAQNPPVNNTQTTNSTTVNQPVTTTGKFRDIDMNPIPLEEEEMPTFVTDAKTGQRIELNPKRDNFNPDIVPDSKYSSGYSIGSDVSQEDKKEEKKKEKVKSSDPYKGLAYAAQFAQPAYALLNPYKNVYNETPVNINSGLASAIPTVGTNINLGRVSAGEQIATVNSAGNALIQNAQNIGGPASVAMQLGALEKIKAGTASAIDATNKTNMQLANQEKLANLQASSLNQKAAETAIGRQMQANITNAQLEAGRRQREATAKQLAYGEKYNNTAGALGAAGVGIATMYGDANKLNTQYKIALATDPTNATARWLQENDPALYEKYIKQTPEPKKFGGPKNSYVSRLGELTKRSLKAKI